MRQWLCCAVRTDEGVSGYGEFGAGQFVRGLPGLVDDLSARVIGKDPRRPARYPRVPPGTLGAMLASPRRPRGILASHECSVGASEEARMTSPRDALGEVAPRLREITDDVLFGEVWERPQLSKRDRSLIVVATLTALYRTDQLCGHIRRALDNGVTREEVGEIITRIAFYAGWPSAVNAARVAKEVFDED